MLTDNSLCYKNLSSIVCILSAVFSLLSFVLSLVSVVCGLPTALYICREPSTNQLILCKTNPILSAVGGLQMNVTVFYTKEYENKSNWTLGENEPNTNPNKPNSSPISPLSQRNKPNSNPIKANQTRSEAEIPTGELLGILKPGTNFKRGTYSLTGQSTITYPWHFFR